MTQLLYHLSSSSSSDLPHRFIIYHQALISTQHQSRRRHRRQPQPPPSPSLAPAPAPAVARHSHLSASPLPAHPHPCRHRPIFPSNPSSNLAVTAAPPPCSPRRPSPLQRNKKNPHKRRISLEKSQKKFKALIEILNPIPFLPSKTLDFLSHEKLLRCLGLRDFVHIEFDRSLRTDLLAQLIANYSSQGRCSYVESVRVNLNRVDLARALRLPLPVKKSAAASVVEVDSLGSAEEIGFVEDLVSIWILLHEDTWMMPNEVLNWTKVIKEGNFEKVDWASLIWFMVEKELVQSPNLVNCYYASHLQHLIRS
ncbi:hypothetical protein RGQ29_000002 [Quercus rubra]|uniref:Uncharacterized protein n=1 Tax=Quercus rubra TaxID=3512 RepID=A0AAN7G572_QUERU|nr:hypothetical protein RGQ29_000002 [Quercus rubra]